MFAFIAISVVMSDSERSCYASPRYAFCSYEDIKYRIKKILIFDGQSLIGSGEVLQSEEQHVE